MQVKLSFLRVQDYNCTITIDISQNSKNNEKFSVVLKFKQSNKYFKENLSPS